MKENFDKTTPDNGIHISNFEGCFDDNELPKYEKFLTQVAQNEVDDVRDVIYEYRDKWEHMSEEKIMLSSINKSKLNEQKV